MGIGIQKKEVHIKMEDYDRSVLIVKVNVRKWFKERELCISSETFREINDKLIEDFERVIKRVQKSRMKTVRPKHI